MTSRALGNGLTQNYTYNTWNQQGGRLQNITTGTLQNLTYAYDPVGNILSIVDAAAGSQTQNFEYDDLDRLWHASATGTEAEGGYAQETYDYDTLTGNLQLKGDLTLHYEDASHAHAATSATKDGVTNTYTYDANGNMETRVANGQSHKFHYDAENRLVSVTDLDGTIQVASFEYDADGARIKSVMDGETIVFIGSHCEIANPGQTQIVTRYYLAGGTRVAMRKGETLSYLLADHISSTSLTTNESGVRSLEKNAAQMIAKVGEALVRLVVQIQAMVVEQNPHQSRDLVKVVVTGTTIMEVKTITIRTIVGPSSGHVTILMPRCGE
jgi:YD repeat-containing protein